MNTSLKPVVLLLHGSSVTRGSLADCRPSIGSDHTCSCGASCQCPAGQCQCPK
ncbi:hypothetical protein BDV29DRAFT_172243 [Aspergillus leporis]|uniref:Uncharacterized protein n=1 Tax=Aspergillus leporis TaxID=41062 RepID=A0A5N5X3W7_9EURO|nr:hypothetical protein BDV29DRAFT_172243 [Aspergillus leporis]